MIYHQMVSSIRDAFKKKVTNVTSGLTPPYCNEKYNVFFLRN